MCNSYVITHVLHTAPLGISYELHMNIYEFARKLYQINDKVGRHKMPYSLLWANGARSFAARSLSIWKEQPHWAPAWFSLWLIQLLTPVRKWKFCSQDQAEIPDVRWSHAHSSLLYVTSYGGLVCQIISTFFQHIRIYLCIFVYIYIYIQ